VSFWRRKREKDLDDEVRSHLEMAARERIDRGESAGRAGQAARREFGNVALVTETTRDVWGWRWLRDAATDARFGLRTLAKILGFTLTAVLALCRGSGATPGIFSGVSAALFKPLAVRGADRLVVPMWFAQKEPENTNMTSYGDCGSVGGPENPGGCNFSAP